MRLKGNQGTTFFNIIAIMGTVLIFVGVAWLIARNWHAIPDVLKVAILGFSTILAFSAGVLLKSHNHEAPGRALIALGALLYILSLFLISQIYHLATTLQHYTWLVLLAWAIILLTAYFLDSEENLVIAMGLFFPWIGMQYFSSIINASGADEGVIIAGLVLLLGAGTLLYSLSVIHRSLNHAFQNIYRLASVFYFLLIFYLLSFQTVLAVLSEYAFEGSAFSIFWIIFVVISFFVFIISILVASSKEKLNLKEILIFLCVLVAIFILVLATKVGAGESSKNFISALPTSLWFLWLVNNFVFIGFIILILGYGQSIGSKEIINLGLLAFVLEVITRYIGFWADLSGYFAFSILAILGGIILILGAWLIPKWRKKLIQETEEIQTQENEPQI